MAELKRLEDAGVSVLGNPDALASILYNARTFQPLFDRKQIAKDDKVSSIEYDAGANAVNVAWEMLRLTLSYPAGYVDATKSKGKLNSLPPYPMIVTLHEPEDFADAKAPSS
jgi:hypothetical protein